jgi:hypothetical protein
MRKWSSGERLGASSTEWEKGVELVGKVPFIELQPGAGSRGFNWLSMRV